MPASFTVGLFCNTLTVRLKILFKPISWVRFYNVAFWAAGDIFQKQHLLFQTSSIYVVSIKFVPPDLHTNQSQFEIRGVVFEKTGQLLIVCAFLPQISFKNEQALNFKSINLISCTFTKLCVYKVALKPRDSLFVPSND